MLQNAWLKNSPASQWLSVRTKEELDTVFKTSIRRKTEKYVQLLSVKAAKWMLERQRSPVWLILDQPQIQLMELGTEERVHVLHAEGRRIFREAPPSCPRRRSARFSDADERLLRFPGLTDFQELQKSFDALLTKWRNGTVLATRRHLKYGLQPAERREIDLDQNIGP